MSTVGETGSTANPPPCIKSYQILPVDPSDPSQLGCASGVQQQFGVEGSATWGAQCADVVWEVTSAATDSLTQASTVVAKVSAFARTQTKRSIPPTIARNGGKPS